MQLIVSVSVLILMIAALYKTNVTVYAQSLDAPPDQNNSGNSGYTFGGVCNGTVDAAGDCCPYGVTSDNQSCLTSSNVSAGTAASSGNAPSNAGNSGTSGASGANSNANSNSTWWGSNTGSTGNGSPASGSTGNGSPASGSTGNGSNSSNGGVNRLTNPLNGGGINSIGQLVQNFVQIFAYIVILFAVLMIIFTGFQYITAMGNSTKIKELHERFLWLVVGIAIVIGARVIVDVVINTLASTGAVNQNVIQQARSANSGGN